MSIFEKNFNHFNCWPSYKRIDFKFRAQNFNTVKIYLKFWDKHETRNQPKIYFEHVITTTFERSIDEIINFLKSNINFTSRWFNPNNLILSFYNKYFDYIYNELISICKNADVKIPNYIKVVECDKYINQNNQKLNILYFELESNENKLKIKINKLNKKIKKRNRFMYKFNWYKQHLENKIALLEQQKNELDLFVLKNYESIEKYRDIKEKLKSKKEYFQNTKTIFKDEIVGSTLHDLTFIPVESFLLRKDEFKNKKGIYVIHNQNLNKYYVGQTKNIYTRVCTQHFDLKTGECKNNSFKDDYNNHKHAFFIAYKFLNTKDELDNAERKYIGLFDSFYNGYNKTNGNI